MPPCATVNQARERLVATSAEEVRLNGFLQSLIAEVSLKRVDRNDQVELSLRKDNLSLSVHKIGSTLSYYAWQEKRQPKIAGSGRAKGTQNKLTVSMKEMVGATLVGLGVRHVYNP